MSTVFVKYYYFFCVFDFALPFLKLGFSFLLPLHICSFQILYVNAIGLEISVALKTVLFGQWGVMCTLREL